jgi:sulfite reductase beta subunit
MAEMKKERLTDIGPPHYEKFLPPVIKENYGKLGQRPHVY